MATQEMHRSQEYAQAVAAIMAAMPPEHAAQVYDFARFLQTRKAASSPFAEETEEWLNDSDEQMQTEDALWTDTFVRYQNKFLSLREAAHAEIGAGATGPEHRPIHHDEWLCQPNYLLVARAPHESPIPLGGGDNHVA